MDGRKVEITGTFWICIWLMVLIMNINSVSNQLRRIADHFDAVETKSIEGNQGEKDGEQP